MIEQELVSMAKNGNHSAFEQLIHDNESRIYNLIFRMVGNTEDAMDLSQETFLNAWKGLSSFNGDSAFSTWLYRLASNVCLDFLRSKKRRQDTLGTPLSLDDEDAPPTPADPALKPDEHLERKERSLALYRALAELPEHHSQILILRELSGLSYQEISSTLELDLGTVKSRLTRARFALKKVLMEDGNFFILTSSNPSSEEKTQPQSEQS